MTRLNPKEIKEKYPQSVEKLKIYLTKGYDELLVPKELQAQVNPDQLVSLTIIGTRGLYEFFDEHDICMHVGLNNDSFGYGFGKVEDGLEDVGFNTRLEAEKSGFLKAFDKLEKQLKDEQRRVL
jgi:hypothetical protein